MKKIFDWVPWFQELASKINEGGRQALAEKTREMDWGRRNPALLKFGDENIDPFSFIYYLAALNTLNNWKTVYRNVADAFGVRTPVDIERSEDFYYPTPPAINVLFHNRGKGNPNLLWNLLEQAVSDSVQSDTFEAALEINGVGVSKLSQTLFLIDPTKFLPFDDHGVLALEIGKYKEPLAEIKWNEYRQELKRIREAFPGCECYEIQHFSYQWNNELMPVNRGTYFQVSTNVYNKNEDHWEDFDRNNWVYTGGPGSGKPWPAQGEPTRKYRYSLNAPVRGDIVLVRYGHKGRGIGIVYKNDYTANLSRDSRLHVLWLNKMRSAKLVGNVPQAGFSRAWQPTVGAFRSTGEYSRTIRLLSQLEGGPPATNPVHPESEVVEPVGTESVKHPLNQIFYGPPGTGKTWNAENHAVAIVDGVNAEQAEKTGRARFHALRFDPGEWTGQIAMVTFHQSFSYEDFVEGIRPKLEGDDGIGYELRLGVFKQIANAAGADPERRYVLIIDEINRGNIPKIFGELITLIEDSRRLGEPDETTLILPYSNEDFGVPKNLYIIGTMNTADRSILLLDTALRRRFNFIEMMPDPKHELISGDVGEVDARKMLKAMNERISLLLDREHQIGHTYLFKVTNLKSLSDKFRNAIFPLLQEYFYDDWSKIRAVLGGAGFVAEQTLDYTAQLRKSDLVDKDRVVYERLPGDDPKWLDPGEYKKIYSDGRSSESS